MTRRQEPRQHPVDVTGAPIATFDGTSADGQQAGQVALARAVRPDDECDPFTEAQLELVKGQHAYTRQLRYPHAPSLETRSGAVASVILPGCVRTAQRRSPGASRDSGDMGRVDGRPEGAARPVRIHGEHLMT